MKVFMPFLFFFGSFICFHSKLFFSLFLFISLFSDYTMICVGFALFNSLKYSTISVFNAYYKRSILMCNFETVNIKMMVIFIQILRKTTSVYSIRCNN